MGKELDFHKYFWFVCGQLEFYFASDTYFDCGFALEKEEALVQWQKQLDVGDYRRRFCLYEKLQMFVDSLEERFQDCFAY